MTFKKIALTTSLICSCVAPIKGHSAQAHSRQSSNIQNVSNSDNVKINDSMIVNVYLVSSDKIPELITKDGIVPHHIAKKAIAQEDTQQLLDQTYVFGVHNIPKREAIDGKFTFNRTIRNFGAWQMATPIVNVINDNGKLAISKEERKYDYFYYFTPPKTSSGKLTITTLLGTTTPGKRKVNIKDRNKRSIAIPTGLNKYHMGWLMFPQNPRLDGTHQVLLMSLEPLTETVSPTK